MPGGNGNARSGNISTDTNTNDLYKYTALMTLVFDGMEPIELGMNYIKGIVIDYKYTVNNFPIIYVTIAIDKKTENILVENQQTGTVIFKLQKYITNGSNPDLKIDCFEHKFIYVLPSSVADITESEDVENPEEVEDIVNTYTIGLAKVEHVNYSKKAINNVIRNGTVSSVIYYILDGQKVLMEPIANNQTIQYIVFPPKGSVAKALEYLNSLYAFYPTRYRFFMDFDVSYLLSSSGKITKRKGEEYTDIIINIRKKYDEANLEGMITNADVQAYVINVTSTYCTISDANMVDKGYNEYSATVTTGGKSDISLSDRSGSELLNKKAYLRLPNNNTGLLENMKSQAQLTNIAMSISTTKVDSTIFNLNKKYTINADDTFGAEYTGQYLLTHRRDVYAPEGEGFNLNITVTFNKIA